jgi:hypothetical protein
MPASCRFPLCQVSQYSYAVPVWGRFLLARVVYPRIASIDLDDLICKI